MTHTTRRAAVTIHALLLQICFYSELATGVNEEVAVWERMRQHVFILRHETEEDGRLRSTCSKSVDQINVSRWGSQPFRSRIDSSSTVASARMGSTPSPSLDRSLARSLAMAAPAPSTAEENFKDCPLDLIDDLPTIFEGSCNNCREEEDGRSRHRRCTAPVGPVPPSAATMNIRSKCYKETTLEHKQKVDGEWNHSLHAWKQRS